MVFFSLLCYYISYHIMNMQKIGMGIMSFTLNLGSWGSVFAVPSKVADEKLKLSSAYQLKVLLYVLGHSGGEFTNEEIGKALGMHGDDVKDALTYWVQEGILAYNENELTPFDAVGGEADSSKEKAFATAPREASHEEHIPELTKKTVMPRAQKPTNSQIAQMVANDKTLVDLLNEVQLVLGKTLSSSDTATIVYLYDTCGLSASVIMMAVEYCITINKPNMRAIERTGVQWADEGIETVLDAEAKITGVRQSNSDFARVASVFGIHIPGTPSQKQLSYANKWVSRWKFSDEMLREAYERCLDAKGEMKFSYIDGILKRWYNDGIKNISEINNTTKSKPAAKQRSTGPRASHLEQEPSYDIDELEKKSFLN